jgi:hypothetical protein
MSRTEIFDLFYQPQEVTRSGGGKSHKKMTRVKTSFESIVLMEKKLKDLNDANLIKYFEKLKTRGKDLAPPPPPRGNVVDS